MICSLIVICSVREIVPVFLVKSCGRIGLFSYHTHPHVIAVMDLGVTIVFRRVLIVVVQRRCWRCCDVVVNQFRANHDVVKLKLAEDLADAGFLFIFPGCQCCGLTRTNN